MARTGENENKAANQQYQQEQTKAFGTAQGGVDAFNRNVQNLEAGRAVAANPWANPDYLATQNRLQSDALNSATDAGKTELQDVNARTGGLNTSANRAAITSLALQKARLANQLGAQRSAQDYNKNVQYQTQIAGMPLEAASAESPYFSGATSGRNASLDNLTKFGLQSQGFWNQLAMMGIKAGAGAIGGAGIGGDAVGGAVANT